MATISYLRVSTKDQATRNGLEEGLSIPAQREAAQRKAEQLGILASMAEFYSLNLAQEVLKGMTQKAAIGGTPTKAPLGNLVARQTLWQGCYVGPEGESEHGETALDSGGEEDPDRVERAGW